MITGGSAPTKTVNILGRTGEIKDLEKELNEINEKVKKLEQEKEDYKNSIEEILEKANILEENLKEIDIQYATDKQKLVSVEENIEKSEKRLLLIFHFQVLFFVDFLLYFVHLCYL